MARLLRIRITKVQGGGGFNGSTTKKTPNFLVSFKVKFYLYFIYLYNNIQYLPSLIHPCIYNLHIYNTHSTFSFLYKNYSFITPPIYLSIHSLSRYDPLLQRLSRRLPAGGQHSEAGATSVPCSTKGKRKGWAGLGWVGLGGWVDLGWVGSGILSE